MASGVKVGLCEPSGKATVNLRQRQGTRSRGRAHPARVWEEAVRLGWEMEGKRKRLSKRALRNKQRLYIRRLKATDDSDNFITYIRLGLFLTRAKKKPTTKKKCAYRTPRRKGKSYVLAQRHATHGNTQRGAVFVVEVGLTKHALSCNTLVASKYNGVTRSRLSILRRYSSELSDMYLSDRIGPKRLQPVAKPAC